MELGETILLFAFMPVEATVPIKSVLPLPIYQPKKAFAQTFVVWLFYTNTTFDFFFFFSPDIYCQI